MNNPICVYGRIKNQNVVTEYKMYRVLNFDSYPPYQFAYWLLLEVEIGVYTILNAVFVA